MQLAPGLWLECGKPWTFPDWIGPYHSEVTGTTGGPSGTAGDPRHACTLAFETLLHPLYALLSSGDVALRRVSCCSHAASAAQFHNPMSTFLHDHDMYPEAGPLEW